MGCGVSAPTCDTDTDRCTATPPLALLQAAQAAHMASSAVVGSKAPSAHPPIGQRMVTGSTSDDGRVGIALSVIAKKAAIS